LQLGRGGGAGRGGAARGHNNDFLWAKILLLLHAENLFIDFGAES
jgi:hypothetical protein